jgi:ACS family glucarate transporter-like MFS transporter
MALTRRFQIRSILIVWIFLLSAVAFMDRTNISIAGLAILDELHIDNVRLGWVFSSFLLGYAVFQVAAGWLFALDPGGCWLPASCGGARLQH